MEAITPHARVRIFARDSEGLRQLRLAAMKRGVETSDLREVWPRRVDGAYDREIVRLMQRRQRNVFRQAVDGCFGEEHGRSEGAAAVHDAMADHRDLRALEPRRHHAHHGLSRRVVIKAFRRKLLRLKRLALRACQFHARRRADAFDQALETQRRLCCSLEDPELKAGRAGVDHGDAGHGAKPSSDDVRAAVDVDRIVLQYGHTQFASSSRSAPTSCA